MQNILVIGATGNVGLATIEALHSISRDSGVVAAVRSVAKDRARLPNPGPALVQFDFADPETYEPALRDCEVLFLLYPPQLSDSGRYFEPFVTQAVVSGVKHVVFLSVQGAPGNRFIPHYNIEKLIVESGLSYTFLRPAYFMQNFTTKLRKDLTEKGLVYLPADNARFTLIDVRDIGAVAAHVLTDPDKHLNQAYDLTSDEPLMFRQMAEKLSEGLGVKINYESPTLWEFFWQKRREGEPFGYILAMIMVHYLPRFQKTPPLSACVEKITGKAPCGFEQFVTDYAAEMTAEITH